MKIFGHPGEILDAVGETFGPGPGLVVDQNRISAFAVATDDGQWIHVDAERAAAGPFGGTIAHGYLTLSLIPALMRGLYRCERAAMTVNYGLNRVRFPAPLLSGRTIHATALLAAAIPIEGGVQMNLTVSVHADGLVKPCCVAELVSRVYEQGISPQ